VPAQSLICALLLTRRASLAPNNNTVRASLDMSLIRWKLLVCAFPHPARFYCTLYNQLDQCKCPNKTAIDTLFGHFFLLYKFRHLRSVSFCPHTYLVVIVGAHTILTMCRLFSHCTAGRGLHKLASATFMAEFLIATFSSSSDVVAAVSLRKIGCCLGFVNFCW